MAYAIIPRYELQMVLCNYARTSMEKGGLNSGYNKNVRRISYGVGVERTFPVHSPRVEDIVVTRKGRVRRSRLFYIRDRQGKAARVKEKKFY